MGPQRRGAAPEMRQLQFPILEHRARYNAAWKAQESEGEEVIDPELKQYLDAMKAELLGRIQESQEQTTEQMRDMQSELLRAFIPAQQQISTRQSTVETRMGGVEARQDIIERRLMEI